MNRSKLSLDYLPSQLEHWCAQLGFKVKARVEASGDEELYPNRITLEGPDAEWLAANRGAALDALQFLVHEAQSSDELAYLDVFNQRLFRMKELKAMSQMVMEKAKQKGSHTIGPLNPRERRWIHVLVSRKPGYSTQSEGTGNLKPLKVSYQG